MESRQPYTSNPFQGSTEASPNASMTDVNQGKSSPTPKRNVAFRQESRSISKPTGSLGADSDAQTHKRFHIRNPFASSADTSPSGSMADMELQNIALAGGDPAVSKTATFSRLNNSHQPVSVQHEKDAISASIHETSSNGGFQARQKREFKTYLLTEKYEQPWKDDKRMKRTRVTNYVIYFFVIAALLLSGFVNYQETKKIENHDYCLVLDDHFDKLDQNIWNHEVQLNGFGTGSFDWTTTDDKNAFVDKEGLHIVPTVTTESTSITKEQILNGYSLNLTQSGGDGSCTAPDTAPEYLDACAIASNSSTRTVVPSVRSARLNTRGKKAIKYGRIEVTARLPKGDWMWPAIWMMPEDSVYGPWPKSGEIDIMESRGNDVKYPTGGVDQYSSALHWGPSAKSDAFYLTTHARAVRRTDYSKRFHTFGIEWSQNYLYTYLDNRLNQVLYVDFKKKNMWQRGQFENRLENFTLLENPWTKSSNLNAPFDQKFYLILNVAVGGRNGWFPDSIAQKPWVDGSASASADFFGAISKWLPTWPKGNDRGMTVSRVQMWQEGKCP